MSVALVGLEEGYFAGRYKQALGEVGLGREVARRPRQTFLQRRVLLKLSQGDEGHDINQAISQILPR